jgi:hypothetical protein
MLKIVTVWLIMGYLGMPEPWDPELFDISYHPHTPWGEDNNDLVEEWQLYYGNNDHLGRGENNWRLIDQGIEYSRLVNYITGYNNEEENIDFDFECKLTRSDNPNDLREMIEYCATYS